MSPGRLIWFKVLIHFGALLPLIWTFYLASIDQLGGDPVESLLHFTGISAFNLLLLSLLTSPLAKMLKQAALIKVRRLLGLYAFVYALIHFLSFIFFELQFEWQFLIAEIIERPYITVGFVALLILFSLALTSTRKSQITLGKKWQALHNWVYLAGILIALHYIWSVKSDILQPVIYWVLLLLVLFMRKDKLDRWLKKRKKNLA
ncbi:MAG: protein-methionine-sulfoxide reductase heme-binding subunit MsrQ [Aliiglaciecola sp.]